MHGDTWRRLRSARWRRARRHAPRAGIEERPASVDAEEVYRVIDRSERPPGALPGAEESGGPRALDAAGVVLNAAALGLLVLFVLGFAVRNVALQWDFKSCMLAARA